MEGKLFKIKLTQAEMYDLGNISNIDHHLLYDSGSKVVVDITAEVEQAPLLSKVRPYEVAPEESMQVLEELLSGKVKPVKNWEKARSIPCITGFEAQELSGVNYDSIRQTMAALRDARKALEDRVEDMRKYCLARSLVKPSEEVRRQL
jgi:hypothetical protein